MLSERRRRFTFDYLSKIFLVLCKTYINAKTLCDKSDYKFLLGSDYTVMCLTILTLTV